MSAVGRRGHSYALITLDDLTRLAQLAKADRESFLDAYPDWASQYADRVLGSALCQGLHFIMCAARAESTTRCGHGSMLRTRSVTGTRSESCIETSAVPSVVEAWRGVHRSADALT